MSNGAFDNLAVRLLTRMDNRLTPPAALRVKKTQHFGFLKCTIAVFGRPSQN
jgi:hypothetical protein